MRLSTALLVFEPSPAKRFCVFKPVAQQDDHVLDGRVLGRGIQRIGRGQRLPAPRKADRLIGRAVGDHLIDRAVQRRKVEAQSVQRHRRAVGIVSAGNMVGALPRLALHWWYRCSGRGP